MPGESPLHPDIRSLYGASLRPPPGTVFDAGVATSYSLEFETALAVPVTLALFAAESRDELLESPLALLEGLERTSDRLALFCEAGRIQAQPKPQSPLCTLLERMIVEVIAPKRGAFHPKLWVLRYRPLDLGEPVRMRLLVLSRNLTRDRSWDLSLVLDGHVGHGRRPLNAPLVSLIRRLPALSTMPVPAHVVPLISDVSDDLERIEWVPPSPFERVSFAVNGFARKAWTPDPCRRMAIVSPFCDADALELLADLTGGEKPQLISRTEELLAVPATALERFAEISVMDELAENEDGEGEDHDDRNARPLSGLHAKAYIQEIGWDTAITVGSGNATRPALIDGRNVEVFATLTGKRAKVGSVSDIIGPEGFGRVLRAFSPHEIEPPDSEQVAAEQRVEQARRALAQASLRLICTQDPVAAEDGPPNWRLSLRPQQSISLEGLSAIKAWPITRGEDHARDVLDPLKQGLAAEIGSLAISDVTRFLGFRLVDQSGKAEALFTLGVEPEGLPSDRHQAVIRRLIHNRDTFLRYLRLLLADLRDPFAAQLASTHPNGRGRSREALDDAPILEDMVRALSHRRDRLQAVHRLMERLDQQTGKDEPAIIPQDFVELWAAFRVALEQRGQLDG